MKISKRQLIKMGACEDGLKRFISQTNNTSELVDVASLVGGKNPYEDLLWLAGKVIDKERIVRFACDCALLNIELIKPYANEYNYNLIVEFLKDPSKNADIVRAVTNSVNCTALSDKVARDATINATHSIYSAVNADAISTHNTYIYAANAAYTTVDANAANEKEVNKLIIDMFNEVD